MDSFHLRHELSQLLTSASPSYGRSRWFLRVLILLNFTLLAANLRGADSVGTRHWPALSTPYLKPGFTLVEPRITGVLFINQLQGDLALTNAVAHNGSGVALGDVDGDGWQDIYLCALQGPNRLYRNLGHWRFIEMELGEAACPSQLSTGAVFADIDGDDDLDLLVNGIKSGTRLFLNDGKGHWTESTNSGLSRSASATSMALADIDGDGDLDLYCTHYSDVLYLADPTTQITLGQQGGKRTVTQVNGQPATLVPWKDRFEVLATGEVRELAEADGFYRNDGGGHFTPIQHDPGTFQDEAGQSIPADRFLGLAVMFRDINGDGAPDFYVANDTGAPDRCWVNTGKGTFRRLQSSFLKKGSHSSMGLDFADLDRDGHVDLLVLDMLARDATTRLRHPSKAEPEIALREVGGAPLLFNRNTLFFGRSDGSFAEAALMAGIAATDWSWSAVFLDVDLDGYEDLLISNGFEQNILDQDSTDRIRLRKWTPEQVRRYRQIYPKWTSANAAFRNRGNGSFESKGPAWGFDLAGVSNGMAVADLDNDGDLDVVINNLNAPASLYRNTGSAPRIAVRLKGITPNTQGVGALLTLSGGPVAQAQEIISGGRYLSGDQAQRVFAAPTNASASLHLEVRWRNGAVSVFTNLSAGHIYEMDQASSQVFPKKNLILPVTPFFQDVSARIDHLHIESTFNDWAQQPLLPHRLSRLGPGLAWYDFNNDGWEDLLITAAHGHPLSVLANREGATFKSLRGADLATGDQGALVGWADGLGNHDFLIASSNQELPPGQPSKLIHYSAVSAPRQQTNDLASVGALAVADIDGDGTLDVFMGGRWLPGRYPEAVDSTVWRNKAGELLQDAALSAPFKKLGMVTGACFGDLDGDGDADLVLALEWGALRLFRNQGGRFEDATSAWGMAAHTGLWTSLVLGDFDADGRLDIAAGNIGRNTPYELNLPNKLGLFYGDFNGDGSVQMIEAWQNSGTWFPIRDRNWLERGMPDLLQRFTTHHAFSKASIEELLGNQFTGAKYLEAIELESAVFLNRGSHFHRIALPREAQWATVSSITTADFDGDGIEDLFISQNQFGTASNLSRDDNGPGTWLKGFGDGSFVAVDSTVSGIRIDGEQRSAAVADFDHDGRIDLAVSQNSGSTKLYQNRKAKPGLRLLLKGPLSNPTGIGTLVRLHYVTGKEGPARLIQAGSGHWSQDSPIPVLGIARRPEYLWIRWPGGREQKVPIPEFATELKVSF